MRPFLEQVASHYYATGDIGRKTFIFPNRRSLVFFRKYLSEAVAAAGTPLESPQMLTVNDFFFRTARTGASDRVRLLLDLYDCYKQLRPKCESLDDFIFWGDLLLNDFDDVDKYLADARQLFSNVADYKGIQDSYSYLSDTQRKAIEDFMGHFHKEGRLTVSIDSDNPNVKERFLQIWDILYPLYVSFNRKLDDSGRSYEGKAYRKIADSLDTRSAYDVLKEAFPDTVCFVFVGLNALNECEKKVMRKMRDAGLAEFCWDYGPGMISDRQNRSSVFMSVNVAEFPSSVRIDDGETLEDPEINVVSVPSNAGQAKQLPAILGGMPGVGINTAIVLPDENLLLPVLNSIPPDIREINVTMGYPMAGSEFYALISDVSTMQMHLRCKEGKWYFYHKQVWAIFSNSVFRAALDEAGEAKAAAIKAAARYYIPQSDLSGNPLFDLIFKPVVKDSKLADEAAVRSLEEYQTDLISGLAPSIKDNPDMALELEFAKQYYLAVNKLKSVSLAILPATYFRLLHQLTATVSVPFRGEPLKGLQIMGPLETRALDFENLIILSTNEGTFPRHTASSSFIPPELRKGFGLPTYEYQDSVWAYYFYRMIRRARKVWMLYDSRTEGLKAGEESRYIKQLELHFHKQLRRHVAKSLISSPEPPGPIAKTEEDIRKIRESYLSASALQSYLACPAQFYYGTVKGLSSENEVSESLDAGMIGNVFHHTMQDIYSVSDTISAEYIGRLLKDKAGLRSVIRAHIMDELKSIDVTGRNLIFEEVVLKYVLKVLERDLELIRQYQSGGFRVLGLEKKCYWDFNGFRFKGYIDRMDSLRAGEVRIVDYKTGKVKDDDIFITDENAETIVDKLFGTDNANRPKIALQLFLYDMFVSDDPMVKGKSIVNSIYQTSKLFVSEISNVPVNDRFCSLMKERLASLLEEIADADTPFARSGDAKTCSYCDFKTLCGK